MLVPSFLFKLWDLESKDDLQDFVKFIVANDCSYKIEDFEEEITKNGYEQLINIIKAIEVRFSEYDLSNDNSIKELENKLKWLERSLEKSYKLSLTETIIKKPFDKIIYRSMTIADFDNLRKDLMKANYRYTQSYDYVIEEVNFVNKLDLYYDELTISELENIINWLKFLFDDFYPRLQNANNSAFNICFKRALRIYIDLLKTSYRESLKKRKTQAKEEQEKRRQYEKAIRVSKNIIGQETLPFYNVEDILKRTRKPKKLIPFPKKEDSFCQQIRLKIDGNGNVYYE